MLKIKKQKYDIVGTVPKKTIGKIVERDKR
jgi:hypothetical protein